MEQTPVILSRAFRDEGSQPQRLVSKHTPNIPLDKQTSR